MTNAASGDGWAAGPGGVRVWGKYGAAGLFLLAGEHLLLQHRAAWTNNGNTWGIPGGARDLGETPEQAALRETAEECGISAADVEVLTAVTTSGPYPPAEGLTGGWTYTSVIARTKGEAQLATVANEESVELRWVHLAQVEQLPLLGAFRDSFSQLCEHAAAFKR